MKKGTCRLIYRDFVYADSRLNLATAYKSTILDNEIGCNDDARLYEWVCKPYIY